MDEELKYKRYRENITNLLFSDGVFRSNLSTDEAASNIIETVSHTRKSGVWDTNFCESWIISHRRVIVTERYIRVNFAYE